MQCLLPTHLWMVMSWKWSIIFKSSTGTITISSLPTRPAKACRRSGSCICRTDFERQEESFQAHDTSGGGFASAAQHFAQTSPLHRAIEKSVKFVSQKKGHPLGRGRCSGLRFHACSDHVFEIHQAGEYPPVHFRPSLNSSSNSRANL